MSITQQLCDAITTADDHKAFSILTEQLDELNEVRTLEDIKRQYDDPTYSDPRFTMRDKQDILSAVFSICNHHPEKLREVRETFCGNSALRITPSSIQFETTHSNGKTDTLYISRRVRLTNITFTPDADNYNYEEGDTYTLTGTREFCTCEDCYREDEN